MAFKALCSTVFTYFFSFLLELEIHARDVNILIRLVTSLNYFWISFVQYRLLKLFVVNTHPRMVEVFY